MNIFIFSPVGNLLLAFGIGAFLFFAYGYVMAEIVAPYVGRVIRRIIRRMKRI